MRATTSSASRCSSTTTARRRIARAPAAPARTSTTRATSPLASAFPITCSTYEERFREKVIEPFARAYVGGETPDSLRRLQPAHEIRRSFRGGERPRRRPLGDRPLCRQRATTGAAGGRFTAPPTRTATRAISCSPPPATQLTRLRFPLGGRCRRREVRELARKYGLVDRRKGRQPGHLLRAVGPLQRHDRAADARGFGSRRDRPCRRTRARTSCRHRSLHHRPAARHRRRRGGAALCRRASMRPTRG